MLCYQWVASITTAVFIGTHTPDFESVRTDDFAIWRRFSLAPRSAIRGARWMGLLLPLLNKHLGADFTFPSEAVSEELTRAEM